MKVQAPFGFVTGCHKGDKALVQATLASMRHFCPEVPICLIVDGELDVSDLVKKYSVQTLFIGELANDEMRFLLSKNPRSKLAALWEGPFEYYVWLDSDAIVWGDIRSWIDKGADFQVFQKENLARHKVNSNELKAFSHFYFDPSQVLSFAPDFDWEIGTYFCSGAFGARRNFISFDFWLKIEDFRRRFPFAISLNDQGSLNFLVNLLRQRGELNVTFKGSQQIPCEHGLGEIGLESTGYWTRLPPSIGNPRVLHFCGVKPYLQHGFQCNKSHFLARMHGHRQCGSGILRSLCRVVSEEYEVFADRIKKKAGSACV